MIVRFLIFVGICFSFFLLRWGTFVINDRIRKNKNEKYYENLAFKLKIYNWKTANKKDLDKIARILNIIED